MMCEKKSMPDKPMEGAVGGDRVRRAMKPSEERLIVLYCLNRVLLTAALSRRGSKAELPASIAIGVAAIGNKLDQDVYGDPEAIAKCTADLFSCIVRLTRNSRVVEAVDYVNDSLYCIRTLECQGPKDIAGELIVICEQLLSEKFDDVQKAITKYHDDRLASLMQENFAV